MGVNPVVKGIAQEALIKSSRKGAKKELDCRSNPGAFLALRLCVSFFS
jgi:hypothetical protein